MRAFNHALCVGILALCITAAPPAAAKQRTVEIVVDEIAAGDSCGITGNLVHARLDTLLEAKGLATRRADGDLIAFADVNVIAIPNSLGTWSGSCSFNINLEFQLHHEARMRGVRPFAVISKLCEAGFTGYISSSNPDYFVQSFDATFEHCYARLPEAVLNVIEQ